MWSSSSSSMTDMLAEKERKMRLALLTKSQYPLLTKRDQFVTDSFATMGTVASRQLTQIQFSKDILNYLLRAYDHVLMATEETQTHLSTFDSTAPYESCVHQSWIQGLCSRLTVLVEYPFQHIVLRQILFANPFLSNMDFDRVPPALKNDHDDDFLAGAFFDEFIFSHKGSNFHTTNSPPFRQQHQDILSTSVSACCLDTLTKSFSPHRTWTVRNYDNSLFGVLSPSTATNFRLFSTAFWYAFRNTDGDDSDFASVPLLQEALSTYEVEIRRRRLMLATTAQEVQQLENAALSLQTFAKTQVSRLSTISNEDQLVSEIQSVNELKKKTTPFFPPPSCLF